MFEYVPGSCKIFCVLPTGNFGGGNPRIQATLRGLFEDFSFSNSSFIFSVAWNTRESTPFSHNLHAEFKTIFLDTTGTVSV